jgi:hypothetical protein
MKGRRITYSAVEMAWLEENRMLVISDYHAAFCATFDRTDVAAANLHSLRKRKGWKVGRAPDRYVGRHIKFSKTEIDWLRDNAAMQIGEYHQAFCTTFNRTDMPARSLHGLRKRKKWKTGRTGHFGKGTVPVNKGKKCAPGIGGHHPNARRTQFKKGQMPQNTKFLGHERVNVAGYVEISVGQVNPRTGFERRYVHKHRWLWEKAHGPVPDGMVLKCKGDKIDTDPSNWELIPRALLPRLNGRSGRGYDHAPADLKPTIMAVAKLEQQMQDRQK